MSKGRNYKMIITKTGELHEKCGNIEYQMPKAMANALLNLRKGLEKNMRPQDFLVKYINEEAGLLHKCTGVIIR